ncbi:rhodanese-like domain-containing protein [Virgibacillus salexigens]|uniref:rhodanese-like domain-containing protein n=1 Tax=Virgibacillus massiliensis TaxID=1462526 RepID=UPI00136861DF|nr:MBL fold metallo-hydrolase [Virgibacillus massiliensis]
MYLQYFYDRSLAQASYMIGCQITGEAAIIDPIRNIDMYLTVAKEQGFRIMGAIETHIHADFASGSAELARRTGATIYYSTEGERNGGYKWPPFLPVQGVIDEQTIHVGNIQLKAVHTPGHTPEHMTYELIDKGTTDQPIGLFTGDFIFVGNVGRPDLLETSLGVKGSAIQGARQMFASIQRFKKYEDYLQIWPGHGAGSACGKGLGSIPNSTVGYEKRTNPALRYTNEQAFMDFLLDGQPEVPAYFAKMKEVNISGLTPLAAVPSTVEFYRPGDEVALLATDKNNLIIDTRSATSFAMRSIPRTINIPYPDMFAEWMGRLANYKDDIYLIADSNDLKDIQTIVSNIGMDNIVGFFSPTIVETAGNTNSYLNQDPKDVERQRHAGQVQILDVRYQKEWEKAHIPGAIHIPLPQLNEQAHELSFDQPVVVHCASGKRSAIAASILVNKGFDVMNLQGGFQQWQTDHFQTTS